MQAQNTPMQTHMLTPESEPKKEPKTEDLRDAVDPAPDNDSASKQGQKQGQEQGQGHTTRNSEGKAPKCAVCKKRLSLAIQISHKCFCGVMLCPSHFSPDEHKCTHDFRTAGKKALSGALLPGGREQFEKDRAARKLQGLE
jgi:hypothetical protein